MPTVGVGEGHARAPARHLRSPASSLRTAQPLVATPACTVTGLPLLEAAPIIARTRPAHEPAEHPRRAEARRHHRAAGARGDAPEPARTADAAASASCRASSATTRPSSPRSRTRSSPATTWCSSASAARRSRASSAACRRCSTRRSRRSPAARSTTIPFAPICTRVPARARRARATRCRSSGSARDAALRREARHARRLDRRPDRRDRSDQGRRGPLPRRRGDDPLRPRPAHQPRHLRHQRAARPDREGAGRPLQPDGGEGRPDQRLQDPPAARRRDRRQRQPRGLHQPRPHHHAAEGSLRRPDPHPLSAHASRTRSRSWSRRCRRSTAPAAPLRVPDFIKEILAQLTFEARASNEINQASGVSVRVTINNYESVIAQRREARRAARRARDRAAPHRPARACSRRPRARSSSSTPARSKKASDLIERLLNRAVLEGLRPASSRSTISKRVIEYFEAGWGVEVSRRDAAPRSTSRASAAIPGLREAIARARPVREPRRSWPPPTEFILEGPAPAPEAQQGRARAAATRTAPERGHAAQSATPPGTARQRVRLTADAGLREALRVPLVHRRRAAGARLAAAPGRSSWDGMRVIGLDDFLEQLREADARALPRVQPRPRARRDAPRSSTSCSTSSATRSTSAGDERARASAKRDAPRQPAAPPVRGDRAAAATTSSRTTQARAEFEHLLEELDEHPRPRGVPAPLRRAVPRAARRSTTSEALELMREMERLQAARGAACSRGDLERVDLDELRELLGDEARAGLRRTLRQMMALLAGRRATCMHREGPRAALAEGRAQDRPARAARHLPGPAARPRRRPSRPTTAARPSSVPRRRKPYRYGDPLNLDLVGTLEEGAGAASRGTPLALAPERLRGLRRPTHATTHLDRAAARHELVDELGRAASPPPRRSRWRWRA